MSVADSRNPSDPQHFRTILGHFPTGVVAVTSLDAEGKPTGMAVGSFTSVSLDPPLVAFLADESSSTFPKIRENGRFCINVLGAYQQHVCSAMSIKGGDKFAGVSWTPTTNGMPRITDSVAWIDCEISDIHNAGDHYIVIGRVDDLDLDSGDQPLVFFQGGFGRFASTSLTAPAELDLYRQLSVLETARPLMMALSEELGVECAAATVVGSQMVMIGSSIAASLGHPPRIQMGKRLPFTAPLGMAWAAWLDDVGRSRWLAEAGPQLDRGELDSALQRVRTRGWALVLHSDTQKRLERAVSELDVQKPDPAAAKELAAATAAMDLTGYDPPDITDDRTYDVRNLSAPVFDAEGHPVIMLILYQAPRGQDAAAFAQMHTELTATASAITDAIGGVHPG